LNEYKTARDEAATFLAEAEENRARQALAIKNAELEEFQVEYNGLKEEYDDLYNLDSEGNLVEGSEDYLRMIELEGLYEADKIRF
jgi:hypothetical protein